MYIRFETSSGVGLFREAERYRRSIGPGPAPLVCREDRTELRELMAWLWERTPVPPARVYRDPGALRLRTWFRLDARECVERAWRLYFLLRRNSSGVRPITQRNPGLIVFRDEVQVVTRPYTPQRSERTRELRDRRDRDSIRRSGGSRCLGFLG